MKRLKYSLGLLLCLTGSGIYANPGGSESEGPTELSANSMQILYSLTSSSEVRSMYGRVFNQLARTGQDLNELIDGFLNTSPTVVSEITRRWHRPAEKLSYSNYRKIFLTDIRIIAGRKFHGQHQDLIHRISKRYGVDEYLLLAIIGVESMYGASHADYRVVDVFHTIAHDVPRKRKWAELELIQFLDYCAKNDIDPGTVWGSYAGAIGYAQFIPSSLNTYGKDHNGDGRIDPYTWEDALESVANYLTKNKYARGSTDFSKGSRNWKSIYAYNHSTNYVRAVLEFRHELKKNIESG
ncbi:MAG: lytic murein transglycosylase [Candidatus Marinimicrobia bacterium]|nr:lytic murein transglycosylase [Candidatus Neomarinimicrobiota bacterium]